MKTHGYDSPACKYISDKLKAKYGLSWHCVLGKGFSAHLGYLDNRYIWVETEGRDIIIFGTTSHRLNSSPSVKIIKSTATSTRNEVFSVFNSTVLS